MELTLETRPARDPFRPFFMVAEAASAQGSTGGAASNVTGNAPAPSGLLLRAIIAGEYAVIGEETVGVGDELALDDGDDSGAAAAAAACASPPPRATRTVATSA